MAHKRTDTLILIPARGGSTRIKGKNIKTLGKKPLLAHIISSAVRSKAGRTVTSTDSPEIAKIAQKWGAEVPFLRHGDMSGASSPSLWVILHALEWFKKNENWVPELVAFCPPTNPFTAPQTISAMRAFILKRPGVNSIVTVVKPMTHPFKIVRIRENQKLQNGIVKIDGKSINDVERTQDYPVVLEGSPACRLTRTGFFLNLLAGKNEFKEIAYNKTYDINNCIAYEIDRFESFDINDKDDWFIAEAILKNAR